MTGRNHRIQRGPVASLHEWMLDSRSPLIRTDYEVRGLQVAGARMGNVQSQFLSVLYTLGLVLALALIFVAVSGA